MFVNIRDYLTLPQCATFYPDRKTIAHYTRAGRRLGYS